MCRFHFQVAREILGGPALRPVPDHQQVRRNGLADLRQNPHAIEHALHRTEIGKVNQQLLARRRVSRGPGLLVVRMVQVAVDEVLDHPDLVRHAEDFHRLTAQVLADRRNPIGFLDRELGDREIRAVGPHQR